MSWLTVASLHDTPWHAGLDHIIIAIGVGAQRLHIEAEPICRLNTGIQAAGTMLQYMAFAVPRTQPLYFHQPLVSSAWYDMHSGDKRDVLTPPNC